METLNRTHFALIKFRNFQREVGQQQKKKSNKAKIDMYFKGNLLFLEN